ncbi:hypothetical protein [Aurantiacibacter marinus]|uniref:hypothetical protein n=1 Tax=Aurantiacibacter marinus TaxID=874156 RepID=UPI00069B2FF1
MSLIQQEGNFCPYPLRAFEWFGNLGIWRSAMCMLSYARAKTFPNRNINSFEDQATNQFGKNLLETFRYPRLGPGMIWEAKGEVSKGYERKQLASDGAGGRLEWCSIRIVPVSALNISVLKATACRRWTMTIWSLLLPRKSPFSTL